MLNAQDSMALAVDKVVEKGKTVRYVARNANGNGSEWNKGQSPKEAVGALVLACAASRPLTVESVEFTY